MAASLWLSLSVYWPQLLSWPFPPGVFIAFLAFATAASTFWQRPPKVVKAILVIAFFGLMCGELWMIRKDRDAHDLAEKNAHNDEVIQSNKLTLLLAQTYLANQHLVKLEGQMAAAKGNPELIALLQKQAEAAKAQVTAASDQLLIGMVQTVANQMNRRAFQYSRERTSITDNASYAAPKDIPARKKVASAAIAQLNYRYQIDMTGLLSIADHLRQQILQGQKLTPEDEKEAASFKSALDGDFSTFDGERIATYLDNLTKRIPQQSH